MDWQTYFGVATNIHADYFYTLAQQHSAHNPNNYTLLADDHDNIIQSVQQLTARSLWGDYFELLRIIGNPARGYLRVHGYWDDLLGLLDGGLQMAYRLESAEKTHLLLQDKATLIFELGELEMAQKLYERVFAFWEETDDLHGQIVTMYQLGSVAAARGEDQSAETLFHKTLDLIRPHIQFLTTTDALKAHCRSLLDEHHAPVSADFTDFNRSRRLNWDEDPLVPELAYWSTAAKATYALGSLAFHYDNLDAAWQLSEQALSIQEALGDGSSIARILHQMGAILTSAEQYDEAKWYFERSMTIKKEFGDQAGLVTTYSFLGKLASIAGELEQAYRFYQQSLSISQKLGNLDGIAHVSGRLGLLAKSQKDYGSAIEHLQHALALARQMGDQRGIAVYAHNLALTYELDGQDAAALPLALEAVALARQNQYPLLPLAEQLLGQLQQRGAA